MKTKRILSALVAAFLLVCLCSCAPASVPSSESISSSGSSERSQPSGASLHIDLADFPILDGSTANLPMMAQVRSEVCGIPLSEAEETVTCTGTSGAWLALAKGESDILLVYEAAEKTKSELETTGTKLDITPIGRNALVFICNADNPVNYISSEQLRGIYSGEITNWSELGGNDEEIVAFQRNETSGSQSLFVKLLMQGKSPMTPPTELQPGSMGSLIDSLASYNNTANAIGYSVYYYASYMYSQPGLKFISVDGVMPSEKTIADGSYPLLNEYFVVIRESEPADSNARLLRDWILSDEGTAAIKAAGYIPLG